MYMKRVFLRNLSSHVLRRRFMSTDQGHIVGPRDWDHWHGRGLRSLHVPLKAGKRVEGERAVVTVMKKDGNKNALFWIPGRNDTFYHLHILQQILDSGFDLWAIDVRRSGRAKFDEHGKQIFEDHLAHDSHTFTEYYEELDAMYKTMRNPAPLNTNSLLSGGSGSQYENVVMYAHSTGALQGVLYASDGARDGHFAGFIFNSPFWKWPLPAHEALVCSYPWIYPPTWKVQGGSLSFDKDYKLDAGGGVNDYTTRVYEKYKFPPGTRCFKTLPVRAGWASAVSHVQKKIAGGQIVIDKPVISLFTEADEVLKASDIDSGNDMIHTAKSDGKGRALKSKKLVERVIGSDQEHGAAHDVLASPSLHRVNEAMGHIQSWLHAHFPKASN